MQRLTTKIHCQKRTLCETERFSLNNGNSPHDQKRKLATPARDVLLSCQVEFKERSTSSDRLSVVRCSAIPQSHDSHARNPFAYVRSIRKRCWSRRLIRAEIRTEQRLWFCELLDSPTSGCCPPSPNDSDEDDVDYEAPSSSTTKTVMNANNIMKPKEGWYVNADTLEKTQQRKTKRRWKQSRSNISTITRMRQMNRLPPVLLFFRL